jgi:uncharacterized Fe-S radical SAM superfamily protein PflX
LIQYQDSARIYNEVLANLRYDNTKLTAKVSKQKRYNRVATGIGLAEAAIITLRSFRVF